VRSAAGIDGQAAEMAAQASGGRVAFSGFLEPDVADALLAALRRRGVHAGASGGYAGAVRRVVYAAPDGVPEPTPRLSALYAEGCADPQALQVAARAVAGEGAVGDATGHADGATVILLAPVPQALLGTVRVGGTQSRLTEVPPGLAFGGSEKLQPAVVPSLRVDVLGARAFKVSRAYFAKGVEAGRVSVNGKPAGKSASAAEGDEVFAAGLGRFKVVRVEGETRRGNLRVTLQVERT
jgi:RNA-binding protein YlmH